MISSTELVPVKYKHATLSTPLRLDLIVEDSVIVENKAKEELKPIDKQQLLTYLKLTNIRLGLLINYNVMKVVDGIHRVVNNL